MRFLMIYASLYPVKSKGTKYLFLSISFSLHEAAFSHIIGILSGY